MIESLSNTKVKYAYKLKQKKYRNQFQEFLVEGEHLVEEALNCNQVKLIFSTENKHIENIEFYHISNDIFKKLSSLDESSGIIAVCKKPVQQKLSDSILILDQIQDPGNMGTLIRTAAAFNFKTILFENSVDVYNDKVIRASQGGIFYIDIQEIKITDFIKNHQEYNYIGTDVLQGEDLIDVKFDNNKNAIILGNEGSGVREEIKQLVNQNVRIPMGKTESLNVAIAGGILMYESYRRK